MAHRTNRLVFTLAADESFTCLFREEFSGSDSRIGGATVAETCRRLTIKTVPMGKRTKIVVEACELCVHVVRRRAPLDKVRKYRPC